MLICGRYLPFEGAGADATWTLELPTDFKSFDYSMISDVMLHMRYTARVSGSIPPPQVISAVSAHC